MAEDGEIKDDRGNPANSDDGKRTGLKLSWWWYDWEQNFFFWRFL